MNKNSPRSKPTSFRTVLSCLLVTTLAASPATLAAQEAADGNAEQQAKETKELSEKERKQQANVHLQRGTVAYKKKDFAAAIQELQSAYDLVPRASILFNLGLISEKQGNLKQAADYYRQFVAAPEVDLKARKRASERLAVVNDILNKTKNSSKSTTDLMPALEAMNNDFEEMGAEQDEEMGGDQDEEMGAQQDQTTDQQAEGSHQADAAEKDSKTASDTEKSSTAAKDADKQVTEPKANSDSDRIDYGWAPYATYSVGTAALVGGVVTLAMYNDSANKAKVTQGEEHLAHEGDAETYLNASGGLFAFGGVMLGIGTYFIVSKQAEHAEESASSTSLSIGADHFSVQYQLDF